MTPALRTRDLAVGYRTHRSRRAVLEHVNLAVHSGELVCLLGANGIGKSTLLRTLARMQPPLWGSVELGGSNLRWITQIELARRLGVVLTERVAVEALPVRRIVELGRYPHSGWFGRITDRDRMAVDWAIDAVAARHLADRDFSRLSDGERQRVMIGRALAQERRERGEVRAAALRVIVRDPPSRLMRVHRERTCSRGIRHGVALALEHGRG